MRASLKRFAQQAFLAGDRFGVHVLPAHYYSSVASRKTLHKTESQWRHILQPLPFAWDIDAQAEWIRVNAGTFVSEMPINEIVRISEAVGGFRYGRIEAQFLYSYVRRNAPRRVVEIGSGSSTLLMSRAVERNVLEGRQPTDIVAFDPYTASRVAHLPHVQSREVGGLQISVDDMAVATGDVVFIDSTHTVRTGSELAHLYLEILPNLPPGVVVHIHDIYLPYLYAPDIYASMFDWQETTLVAALLAGNERFSILAALSGLFHERPGVLREVFPEFRPMPMREGIAPVNADGHFPSALWLRTVGR